MSHNLLSQSLFKPRFPWVKAFFKVGIKSDSGSICKEGLMPETIAISNYLLVNHYTFLFYRLILTNTHLLQSATPMGAYLALSSHSNL